MVIVERRPASDSIRMQSAPQVNPWLALAIICVGSFTITLDTTIVNIAVPTIISGLHASLAQVLWVINGYLLIYAVMLIPAGRLGDMLGQRNMLALGIVVFTTASAACGLAQDATQLIAFRVIQGFGGALIAPQGLAIITAIFPKRRRGAAMGVFGGITGLAAIGGPILGGWIIATLGWRWIFEINVPVGLIAVIGALLVLPRFQSGERHSLDPVGVLFLGGGLFALVYGLLEGQKYGWGTITGWLSIPLLIGVGIVVLTGFAGWELFHKEGLVPLRLFSSRNYAVGNVTLLCVFFAMMAALLPLVLFFQSVLGLTPLATGFALAPMFVGLLVAAPIGGKLVDRLSGKYILLAGCLIAGSGLAWIVASVSLSASVQSFIGPLVVTGAGIGLTSGPLFSLIMAGISKDLTGAASGFLSASRQLGMVVGTAVIGAILQNRLAINMHDQAVQYSTQLPGALRQRFIDGLSGAVSQGAQQLGRGSHAGPSLPVAIPAALANQLKTLAHGVFTNGYVQTMRPTLGIGIGVMGLAVLSVLSMANRQASTESESQP